MRVHLAALDLVKYVAILLTGIGVGSLIQTVGFGDGVLARSWWRYVQHLDKVLRLLFKEGSGKRIVRWQLGLIAAILAVELALFDVPYWYVFVAVIAIAPAIHLAMERKKRLVKLESQIDGFILSLANSMKTVPGPAAALQAVVPLLHNPTKQEIDLVVAEMRVGNTLEQALINMSARIGSRTIDSALSAVLIGLQVGGNLPTVLENTAATIREMNRLEGVVRSKTGEGRAQLWVLVGFPFGICAAFNFVQPGYFDPLQQSFAGYAVMTLAITLWVAALLLARKVLTVDI